MNKTRNSSKRVTNAGKQGKRDTKCKQKTLKQRKVSAAAVSRWQSVPAPLQECVMSMLEDSMSRFAGSENEDVDRTLDRIHTSIQRTLRKTKVPQEKWTDIKSLKAAHRTLLEEKKRLEEREAMLEATLEKETRQLERLEAEVDRLKDMADTGNEQLHPVLQRLQESP